MTPGGLLRVAQGVTLSTREGQREERWRDWYAEACEVQAWLDEAEVVDDPATAIDRERYRVALAESARVAGEPFGGAAFAMGTLALEQDKKTKKWEPVWVETTEEEIAAMQRGCDPWGEYEHGCGIPGCRWCARWHGANTGPVLVVGESGRRCHACWTPMPAEWSPFVSPCPVCHPPASGVAR